MAVEVICQVMPGGLRCVNEPEASKLESLEGKEVSVKIYIPRNLKFHRKYFALLKTALDMSETEMNLEQFRWIVLTGIGHCDFVQFAGKTVPIPKSIDFASLDDAAFEQIYSNSLTFICANFVSGTPESMNEILNFL